MSALTDRLHTARKGFEGITPRERVLLIAAVCVLLFFSLDASVYDRQRRNRAEGLDRIDALHQQKQAAERDIARLNAALARPPQADSALAGTGSSADAKASNIHLLRAVDRLMTDGIATRPRMEALLRGLLDGDQSRIALASLRTLAVREIAIPLEPGPPDEAGAAAAPPSGARASIGKVYLHGVEVALRGDYLSLLAFVERLSAHPAPLLWGDSRLEVQQHPDAVLRLSLYTLSREPEPRL